MGEKLFTISTGSEAIDAFLSGGIRSKEITHIYGPAGVGKTTLAIQLSINTCLMGFNVIYIDSNNNLSPERVKQISGHKFNKLSDRIMIYKPLSFKQQFTIIEKLEKYLDNYTRLIVIDTLTSLYRVELTGEKTEDINLNIKLNMLLAVLLSLAKKFNLAVIVVNQVRGTKEKNIEFEPAAKNLLEYWASITILLKPSQSLIREAIITDKLNRKNILIRYQIENDGIIWNK